MKQEEYITPEERAKEIEENQDQDYKQLMQSYATTILSRIEGSEYVTSILEYFEENYKKFNSINIVKITLERQKEKELSSFIYLLLIYKLS